MRRARGPLARGASLALCGLMVALPAATLSPHAAGAAPATPSARISIDHFSPKAANPKAVVRLSGRIVNSSANAMPSVTVRLRYSSRALPSRSQLKLYADDTAGSADPQSVATQGTLAHGVRAKSSANWSLKVPVSRLGLPDTLGVYPIAVDAVDAAGRSLAQQRTFLTYGTKSPAYRPTKIAWLWPIVDRPRRADNKTYMDSSLGQSIVSRGRLSRLVDAGVRNAHKVPLTWMVDPSLLDDVDGISRPHQVIGSGNSTKTEPADSDATAWLGRLKTAVGNSPLATLPYGDIDAAAVTRAGLDDDVKPAIRDGAQITQRLLKRAPATDLAWPSQGLADADTMDVLAFAGAHTVVLSQRALPTSTQLSYTPDGVARLPTSNGSVKVLLTDPTLSDVLGGTQEQTSAAVTEQRFLAETALITAELPNSPRTVVVAPPRRWDPANGLPEALLNDTRQVPWIKPVSATSAKAGPKLDRKLEYTSAEQQDELGQRYLGKVADIRTRARRFGSIFPGGTAPDQLATYRMESSAWRSSPTRARRLRERVHWSVDQTSQKVNFVNRASVTLGGSEAQIPVTIANDLDAGDGSAEAHEANTATVRVNVTAPESTSISIGSYNHTIHVGPQSKYTVHVPVTARAVTVTKLRLELATADGKPINPPVEMKIQATNIGQTASWITGAALAVLVIAAVVRILRRRSRTRDDGGKPATSEPAASGPDGSVPNAVKVASSSDAPKPDPADPADPAGPADGAHPDDHRPSTPGEPGMSSGNVREHRRP
ncbi:MAG TPA: DUF6049 family protein [Streptosporangiaceae bacterium]|jgi:hypothetical protein